MKILVLAPLLLPAAPGGEFASLGLTTEGCVAVTTQSLTLEVCTAACGTAKSSASFVAPETGVYTFDVVYEVNHDCCVLLQVTGGVQIGDVQDPAWCSPQPCTGTREDLSVYLFEGQPATFELRGTSTGLGCGLGPKKETVVRFENLEINGTIAQPTLASVGGTPAYVETPVQLFGTFLVEPLTVELDGVALDVDVVPPNIVEFVPPVGAPGFHDLRVTTPGGALELTGGIPFWPTLAVNEVAPLAIDLVLDAKANAGPWAVALGTGALAAPVGLGPGVHHGLELDPLAPWLVVAAGSFTSTEPVRVPLVLPDDPSLAGFEVVFQGLAPTGWNGLGHGFDLSFTNLAAFTL